MNTILDNAQFNQLLEANPMVLAYFSGPNCGVCDSLQPKVEQLIGEEFPQVKLVDIPTDKAMELAARFRMFTVPAVMFFVEGREYIREARSISTADLAQKMHKIVSLYED